MSTELANLDDADTELTVLPPSRPTAPLALGQLLQHAEAMSSAKELAEVMCGSELVPQLYRGKPGNGTVAILYGAELGLNPIQSLQQIFVVHGMPAVYARTMVALLKSHGYLIRTVESADESVTVWGQDPQSGLEESSTWTLARANKAGYTTNKKYQTDPQAMLYAKAATEVCRKLAPEVLLGIAYSREELELEEAAEGRAPKRVQSQRGTAGLAATLGVAGPNSSASTASEPPAEEPTKDQYARLASYFKMAELDGKTAAAKSRREIVTSKLLDRNNFGEQPLSGAEVEKLIGLLDQINNEGEGVLAAALTELTSETDTSKEN